jgi:hypothetical protein
MYRLVPRVCQTTDFERKIQGSGVSPSWGQGVRFRPNN